MAASTFWLLNALNKSYSTQTTYPVKFVYDENELVPVKPLPEEVTINVTGKGWKLLRKSLRVEVQPAEIFIRNLPRNNYLLGPALRPALVNALDGMELNFVVTDTLYFNFNQKVSRTVAVKLDPSQKVTGDRFAVVGPVIMQPDSVTFTGPSSMVESLPNPLLVRLPEGQQLTEATKLKVPINYDNKALVKADASSAEVTLNVRGLVQEERQIVPEIVNAPAGKEITLRPPYVLVRYQLLEDSAVYINRDNFKAILNYKRYSRRDSTLIPELVQKPTGVRNVTLWPERVKAVVE
ncbi:YbbR-like domain-containing protein [Pontibacter cellulosilyticus]|uniref:hypothetical protein n=1 Tax=Pontibacter cellulosilyticus TaxID=1720253 RepID=UPI00293BCE94|nr:hypothetical protein [Pontibacter cellulosilyticus]